LSNSRRTVLAGAAFEEDVVRNNDRGATVLLQDGEDVLKEVELKCRCGSHLLVLAQKSSRCTTSDCFSSSPASLTIVTQIVFPNDEILGERKKWCLRLLGGCYNDGYGGLLLKVPKVTQKKIVNRSSESPFIAMNKEIQHVYRFRGRPQV